jgi:hypothetical protein
LEDYRKIVWLASYPKSGNTWFRAFLTALHVKGDSPLDINRMNQATIASSRELFDEYSGIPSSDLTFEEIDRLRPLVYRNNVKNTNELIYHKIHDAWTLLPNGDPLFPKEITKAAIYLIRNPLDIVVSFSNHLSVSIDKTIEVMNNPGYAFCNKYEKLLPQLKQKLLTWSGHVKSWTEESDLPVKVLRYEDMKNNPFEAFAGALEFIDLHVSKSEIENAIQKSSFDELKKLEEEKGFIEKNKHSASFFRKGITGDWKNVLSPEQVKRITDIHGETMKRFHYL